LPLRTLNPPNLHRVARAAALARVKELEDVTAELLRIKLEKAQAVAPAQQPPRKAPTRGAKRVR
jgi:hypothetical protein